jgi:hypothetical protein
MRKNLLPWAVAAGAVASLALTSCTYDPAYTTLSGSYSTGYGYGYGYGGSGFSTSVFVSTGDPRWGYDPYTYSYYDYYSRRYYDPYLYGYYPIGYRPPVLIGVPHPYGWRPGHGYCPPPRTVRNVTVVNYQNRESAYRNTNHSWARQVRQQPVRQSSREADIRRDRAPSTHQNSGPRPTDNRGWLNPRGRDGSNQGSYTPPNTGNRNQTARPPMNYSTPVTRPDTTSPDRIQRRDSERAAPWSPSRQGHAAPAVPQAARPDGARYSRRPEAVAPQPRQTRPVSPPAANPAPTENPPPSRGEGRRGLRSLGEG